MRPLDRRPRVVARADLALEEGDRGAPLGLVQRKELKGLLSADIDFADSDSRELMNSVYGTAPGAGGQRWSPTPRGPPFFHTKSRPYPGLAGEAIGRDAGLDMYYDSAATTLAARADTTPRRYASAFPPKEARTGQLGRVIPKKDLASNLGPGTYHSPSRTFGKGVACGGLKTLDEWDRPSSTFAPRVGGKFAHVGGGGYW